MNYLKLATIVFTATLSISSFANINRVEVDGDQYYAHFECNDEEKVLSEINSFIETVKDNIYAYFIVKSLKIFSKNHDGSFTACVFTNSLLKLFDGSEVL